MFTKASRCADGKGTNPEKLLGAAHAGCFSQYLALLLTKNETPPTAIQTTAKVSIMVGDDGPTINRIALSTVVDVDLPAEKITELANQAKVECHVSKARAGVSDVSLDITKASEPADALTEIEARADTIRGRQEERRVGEEGVGPG